MRYGLKTLCFFVHESLERDNKKQNKEKKSKTTRKH